MTQYKAEFPFPALFPPLSNKNVLAEWLATHVRFLLFSCCFSTMLRGRPVTIQWQKFISVSFDRSLGILHIEYQCS